MLTQLETRCASLKQKAAGFLNEVCGGTSSRLWKL